jgi:type IV pilus assembly protein PilN
MIRINLLPLKAAQKKEKLQGQLIVLAILVGLTLAGCFFVYGAMLTKISAEKKSIAEKEAESAQLQKVIGEVAHFEKLQKDLRGKLDVLEKIKSARNGPVHLMDELIMAVPDKLWITSYKEKAGSIDVSGVGFSEEIVADFLKKLEDSPYYRNVELKVIEQKIEGKEGIKLQRFDIKCFSEAPPEKKIG